MKKIVSNVLIVSTQLIVGGLFLFMLFSDNNEDNRVVVIENNNLDKMADAVSELFVVDHAVTEVKVDEKKEEELFDAEQKRLEEEARLKAEAEAQAAAEAQARAQAEEAARLAAEEANRRAQEEAQRKAAAASVDNSVAALQGYARDLVINTYGWSESDFTSLVSLWNRESGWNYQASNGSAYGIPQALPGSKMSSCGEDYLTNGRTQIRWGLGYIQNRYGSPSAAWNFFLSNGWY